MNIKPYKPEIKTWEDSEVVRVVLFVCGVVVWGAILFIA